jgi:NAD(P)H-hydrate repair Nnr-like enzyme with NAD(P)H-hydrate dehydratase domain
VIAALIAQGLSPADAARFGVYVHARAGELLEARFGRRGAIASDLPEAIACAIDELA